MALVMRSQTTIFGMVYGLYGYDNLTSEFNGTIPNILSLSQLTDCMSSYIF